MKKKQTVLLALAIFTLSLTGCSGQTAAESASAANSRTENEEQDKEQESDTSHESESAPEDESSSDMAESTAGTDLAQSDYILPDSSTRELTERDVTGMTQEGFKFARNEIYARHGRIFRSEELQNYFNSKSWYRGTIEGDQFSEDMLSDVERKNVDFLKSHEITERPSALGMKYKNLIENNDILDQYGLADYGYIQVMKSYGQLMIDRGSYYEATDQTLESPIYYNWDYVNRLKPGDQVTYEFGGESCTSTITRILKEKDRKFRLVEAENASDSYKHIYIYEDIFNKNKYAMAEMTERSEDTVDTYTGYAQYERSNGLTDCSSKIIYSGSFYLSKNCVVIANKEYTIEEIMDENGSWGFIAGWIAEIDQNGYITKIRQQTAG